MPETPITPAEHSQPDDVLCDLAQVYANARATATRYPVTRQPQPRVAYRLTAESHWRGICAELTAARSLSRPFLD